MIREHREPPKFKIETVDEWMKRTKKKPKQVNFSDAYIPPNKGFATKFQLTSAEAKAKRNERARRFKELKNGN